MKKILCLVFAGFGAVASAGAQSLPLACTEVGTQLEYADYDSLFDYIYDSRFTGVLCL